VTENHKLDGLQALRAVAALAVVVFHAGRYVAGQLPEAAWAWGEFGVDIFFVLSGFVMAWATRPGMRAASFLARRIARIAPMYWLATLAMALAMYLMPNLFHAAVLDPVHLAKSLAFVPHFNPGAANEVWPLFVPGWTLNYEMYFYLVFASSLPLIAALGRRVVAVAVVLALGMVLAVTFGNPGTQAWAAFLANPIVFEFALGMGVAWMVRRGARVPHGIAVPVAAMAFAVLIATVAIETRIWSAGGSAVAMVFAMASVPMLRSLAGRALVRLGDASYTLYLIQPFVIGALWLPWRSSPLNAGAGGAWGFILVCLLASALASLPIHRWIEQPITRWLTRGLTRPLRSPESA
jgi:exopolysaccharide production protein ExoZ